MATLKTEGASDRPFSKGDEGKEKNSAERGQKGKV